MAHERIIVFSHTQVDAERLIERYCFPTQKGTIDRFDSNLDTIVINNGTTYRWDDYRVIGCLQSSKTNISISAFITADGQLIEASELAWHGVAQNEKSVKLTLKGLFNSYLNNALSANVRLFLVECHI